MFRKSLIALTLFAGLSGAGIVPAEPARADVSHARAHGRVYYVYYRSSAWSAWACYGGYYDLSYAQQAANWFRWNGYEAFCRAY